MKIDTEIRHVTKPGANLFRDLAFPSLESKRLQATLRKQIVHALRLQRRRHDGTD